VVVNGRRIKNAAEPYPLLSYAGTTYFPLTARFASQEFGWVVEGDSATGLRISSVVGAQDAAANLLSILNRTYFTPRAMLGSLEDLNTGALSYFAAQTDVKHFPATRGRPAATHVDFTATPFDFSDTGEGLASGTVSARFTGTDASRQPTLTPSFPYPPPTGTGRVAAMDFAQSEQAYLLRSFLRLRFVGAARERVISAVRVAVDGRFETWELNVHLPDEGFYAAPRLFVVQATLLLDTERGLITHTSLANNRFRLRLSTR